MAADTLTALAVPPEIPESMENWIGVQDNTVHDQAILQELGQLLSQKGDSGQEVAITDTNLASLKRKSPAINFFENGPSSKRSCAPKAELLFATEPVTPVTSPNDAYSRNYSSNTASTSMPLSPGSQSLCSEEEDDHLRTLPTSPISSEFMVLPTPSKDQAAKRRALRVAHRMRSRCKKEEGSLGRNVKNVSDGTKGESDTLSVEPIDKKAARAIRNREAAMKSRVEAKQKMRKLEEDNDQLAHKVQTLSDENKVLTEQLRSLVCHTFGSTIAQGHDIKDILALVSQMNKTGNLTL